MKYKVGCLLAALESGEVDYIVHGVNCSDGFGSGIAAQIAESFPQTKEQYHSKYEFEGWKLGEIQETVDLIINLASQNKYGKFGNKYCSYDAIEKGLNEVNSQFAGLKIGLPKIGAGLGGGNWNIIEKIIEETLTNVDYTIYTLEE